MADDLTTENPNVPGEKCPMCGVVWVEPSGCFKADPSVPELSEDFYTHFICESCTERDEHELPPLHALGEKDDPTNMELVYCDDEGVPMDADAIFGGGRAAAEAEDRAKQRRKQARRELPPIDPVSGEPVIEFPPIVQDEGEEEDFPLDGSNG